eukprot:Hpha_TRINITY_DN15382_c2_g4::TRINITY_DN15382_c2_g4_i1::g.91679::m.91679
MDFGHPLFGEWPPMMSRRSFPGEYPYGAYQQRRRAAVLPTQAIPYECRRHGNNLVIFFDLPGVRDEDIEVSCREGLLKVKATKMVETWEPPYRGTVPLLASMQLPKGLGNGRVEHTGRRLIVIFPMLERRQERTPKRARVECDADEASDKTWDSYGTAEGPTPPPQDDPLSEAESSEQSHPLTHANEEVAPCGEPPTDASMGGEEEAVSPEGVVEEGSGEGDTVMQGDDTDAIGMTDEQRQLIAASQAKLDAIAEAVAGVVREHEGVAFRRVAATEAHVDKARKYYNELLLQQTLKLDQVESHGDVAVRQRRKHMINSVQELQERMDDLIAAEKR